MHFVIDSSGEEERVCRPGGAPIAEGQGPQPVNRYRLVVGVHKQAVKPSSLQVEGGDLAAAELTDQHSIADAKRDTEADGGAAAEIRWRQRNAPGRVHPRPGLKAQQQVASRVKRIDIAKSRPGDFVLP